MSSWLGKKLHNQFKSLDVTKTALSKLHQFENRSNVSEKQSKMSKETSFRCPNCSAVSALNNTVSVTLNPDLLANTELGNITTIEEVSRDPGFQDFLSNQLQLYYKFIINSSHNNLLSAAKVRAVTNDEAQSSCSTARVCEKETRGQTKGQSKSSTCISLGELGCPLDAECGAALSFIEEEESRERPDKAEEFGDVPNPLRERSPLKNIAKVNSASYSRSSRLNHVLKGKPVAGACAVPETSVLVDSKRTDTVKKGSVESTAKLPVTDDAERTSVSSGRPSYSSRMNRSTARAIAITGPSEQSDLSTSRTASKRYQNSAKNEISVNSAQQADDDVFKVPLPPKQKVSRSGSNSKRNDAARMETTKGDQRFGQKSTVARSQSLDSENSIASYRSRTGRVSKPPGSFWNPRNEIPLAKSETAKSRSNESLSKRANKRPSEVPGRECDSESGYSSGKVSRRRAANGSKMTRTESVKETEEVPEKTHNVNGISTKETQKRIGGRPRKRRGTRTEDVVVGAAENSRVDIEDEMTEDEKKKPSRRGMQNKETEKTKVENKEGASNDPRKKATNVKTQSKEVFHQVVKPIEVEKRNEGRSTRRAAALGAVKKHIFSDSCSSSEEESCLISNTTARYDRKKGVDFPQIAGRTNERQSGVESSCDEEMALRQTGRHPVKQPDLDRLLLENSSDEEKAVKVSLEKKGRLAGSSRHLVKQFETDRLLLENSSDEEEASFARRRTVKSRKPVVKGQPQVAKTKQLEYEDEVSPLVNPKHKKKSHGKGRFLFTGSSTEEDSLCSYTTTSKKRKGLDTGSFVDDASYVSSSTRTSRDREIPQEDNGRTSRIRRGRFVSTFRL